LDVFGEIRGQAPGGDGDRPRPRFPDLPIINPNEVPAAPTQTPTARARSQREKYGGLFYLGIGGILLLIALVGWFGHGLWSNRDIWADVYALNDPTRPESERLDAALRLARNPRLDDGPRMEMALQKGLPELARYLLAESITTEPMARDPRAYALAASRSQGWPDWLRLLLARRLAYGAGRGYAIPREALDELKHHSDPMIGLWATYSLAVLPRTGPDPALTAELEQAARAIGPTGELAGRLLDALRTAEEREREQRLDEATKWLRRHHHEAAEIWQGRQIRDEHVVGEVVS
jgi:hypothetical protein